jgi:hypothetical protein
MNDYALEHICSFTGVLHSTPEVIGPVPTGLRVNFYSAGGQVTGPRVRGSVRAVGGDWFTVRPDGIASLSVRTTFETHDGALIDVRYGGVADLGDDGHARFLRGELPEVVRLRTRPRFLTAHPDYRWLNRLFCVGIGEYDTAASEARYDVYAIR